MKPFIKQRFVFLLTAIVRGIRFVGTQENNGLNTISKRARVAYHSLCSSVVNLGRVVGKIDHRYRIKRKLKKIVWASLFALFIVSLYRFQNDLPFPNSEADVPSPKPISIYDSKGVLLYSLFEKSASSETIPSLLTRETQARYQTSIADLLAKRLLEKNADDPLFSLKTRVLSVKLATLLSSKQLNLLYFNTTPFRDVVGVKTASRRFFNKGLGELTKDEAVFLASIQNELWIPSARNNLLHFSSSYKRSPFLVDFILLELFYRFDAQDLLKNGAEVTTYADASLTNDLQKQILLKSNPAPFILTIASNPKTHHVYTLSSPKDYYEKTVSQAYQDLLSLLFHYSHASKENSLTAIGSVKSLSKTALIPNKEFLMLSEITKNTRQDALSFSVLRTYPSSNVFVLASSNKNKSFANRFANDVNQKIQTQSMQASLLDRGKEVN